MRLGKAGSAKLMATVDELIEKNLSMRAIAEDVGQMLHEMTKIGYDRQTMDALNCLHYPKGSPKFNEAMAVIKSRLYVEPKPTSLPGVQPAAPVIKLPGT